MPRRMSWQPMRELAGGSLTTTYQPLTDPALNSATPANWGLPKPARQFFIQNSTDKTLYISWTAQKGQVDVAFTGPSTDGITYRNVVLPPNGYFVSDITTNQLKSQLDDGPALAKGVQVTAMSTDGLTATGTVYFSYWCEIGE